MKTLKTFLVLSLFLNFLSACNAEVLNYQNEDSKPTLEVTNPQTLVEKANKKDDVVVIPAIKTKILMQNPKMIENGQSMYYKPIESTRMRQELLQKQYAK